MLINKLWWLNSKLFELCKIEKCICHQHFITAWQMEKVKSLCHTEWFTTLYEIIIQFFGVKLILE